MQHLQCKLSYGSEPPNPLYESLNSVPFIWVTPDVAIYTRRYTRYPLTSLWKHTALYVSGCPRHIALDVATLPFMWVTPMLPFTRGATHVTLLRFYESLKTRCRVCKWLSLTLPHCPSYESVRTLPFTRGATHVTLLRVSKSTLPCMWVVAILYIWVSMKT